MSDLTIYDVAAWFLRQAGGELVTLKLHKLCFYAQAWSLVWDGGPMFDAEFTVWANGPMSNDLEAIDQHQYVVVLEQMEAMGGDPDKVQGDALETCEAVQRGYGKFSATQLSALSRAETPWKDASRGVAEDEWGQPVIPQAAMKDYYTYADTHPEGSQLIESIKFASWIV